MKRKIGELRNKPIVEGDKNLVTKDEVHIDELKNNGEGGSGGGELSPDAIVLQPNGWYWKFTDDAISTGMWLGILLFLPRDFGMRYFSGRTKISTFQDYRDIWFNAGYYSGQGKTGKDRIIYAISESIGCSVVVDEQTTIVGDSAFEIANQLMPMTEAEFEAFMLENAGLQRITKEEYESLIIA